MEEENSKYSLVTGEKIKKKSVQKIKKEHKLNLKKDKINNKKLKRQIKKVDKKLNVDSDPTLNDPAIKTSQTKVLIVKKPGEDVPVTPKRKVLSFISYVLVGIVAVLFGYISGNFYVLNVLNKVDYGAFSEADLRADGKAVYEKMLATPILTAIKNNSAADLFVAGEYLLSLQDSYYVAVSGKINPSIGKVQDVWGFKSKSGDKFIVENISKGMLSVGERIEYDTIQKQALVYGAEKIGDKTVTFSKTPTTLTYEEFREEYGTEPTNPAIPYIINSKTTVIEGSETVTNIGGNLYRLTFSLTNDSSVINYVKQVKHMSGLKDYPAFKNVTVTATIQYNANQSGNEFKLTYIRFDEAYTVMYFGVMANCTGYLENNFTYEY